MLGDVIEVSLVVRNIETAIQRFEDLFGLKVYKRGESKEFGFRNAILPLGKGHIELMEPTDTTSAVARFLEKHGEGVYLVGFDTENIPENASKLQEKGVRVTLTGDSFPIAWLHPKDTHGLFVELRKPEKYD